MPFGDCTICNTKKLPNTVIDRPDVYIFRVKELKKDSPATPSPRPLTVPTTIAEADRLLSVNKTSGLPSMEIQVINLQLCNY